MRGYYVMAIIAIMKTASISELKNSLSAFLAVVRSGESVLVLDRDVPIAIIERVVDGVHGDARALKLERAGLVRRPVGVRPLDLKALRRPAPKSSASVLQALIEGRREGR